jgi:signal transduction histidine kinase/ligand-binding sensor domain-containing protein
MASSMTATKSIVPHRGTRCVRESLPAIGCVTTGASSIIVRFLMGLLLLAEILISSTRQCTADPLRIAQWDHVSWTARDGAPNDTLNLAQDRDGSLWLLARNGLYNFDGFRFTPPAPGLAAGSASPEFVGALLVAKNGCLWLGSRIRGISQLCGGRVVKVYGMADGLPEGEVAQIIEAPDGTVTAVARNHLVQLRGERWEEVIRTSPLANERIGQAFFDREGRLLVMTDSEIWYRVGGSDDVFRRAAAAGANWGQFAQQPDGSLWTLKNSVANTPAAVERLFLDDVPRSHPERILIRASAFIADRSDAIWIAADKGLVKFVPHSQRAAVVSSGLAQKVALDESYANSVTTETNAVLQDESGNIWSAGTDGLDRFKVPRLVRFIDQRLSREPVLTVCPSGEVWIATYDKPVWSVHQDVVTEHGPKRDPTGIYCDQAGAVWLAEYSGFFRYQAGHIEPVPLPPGIMPLFLRQAISGDAHVLYVSITRSGLWTLEDGKWNKVSAPGFPEIPPVIMFIDSRGQLWAGYIDNRIAILKHGVGTTFSGGQAASLGEVQAFLESKLGQLAGGTNGIAIFHGDHFQSLFSADPNAIRGISGMLEAPNGDLWLNGLHGVVRVPVAEVATAIGSPGYRMHTELIDDAGITGPSSQMIHLPSAVADGQGRFWFATSSTLASADPTLVKPSAALPKLRPLIMTVDGHVVERSSRLTYGEHTVRIQYLGIYLTAPEKVTYRYRLDGVDTDWQDVGPRSEAVYTELRPGHYQFHLMASNGQSNWTHSDDSLQFDVIPRFYQTIWFAVACLVGAALLLWIVARMRVRQLTRIVRRRAEERADERIRIARDLHDTLLQGVQGLMLRFHAAAQEVSADVRARGKLDDALGTADRILVEARDRVSRLRAHDVTGIDLAESYSRIGEDQNYEKSVAFTVDVHGNALALQPIVLEELYFVGREAITNAFRHADATAISVTVSYASEGLTVTFQDNGCGFHALLEPHKGQERHWGISGMMERAHRIGAAFECRSSPGNGTTIVVNVPKRRAYKHNTIASFFRTGIS